MLVDCWIARQPVIEIQQLFEKIAEAAPGFRLVMEEHLADNDALLPHVLMADCGRFVASYFTGEKKMAGDPPSADELRGVLAAIDAAMGDGDEPTQNVVSVSFVEQIWLAPYYPVLYGRTCARRSSGNAPGRRTSGVP